VLQLCSAVQCSAAQPRPLFSAVVRSFTQQNDVVAEVELSGTGMSHSDRTKREKEGTQISLGHILVYFGYKSLIGEA